MKKAILIFSLLFSMAVAVNAQTVIVMKKHFVAVAGNVDVAFDTVTNTGTNYLTNLVPATLSPGGQRTVVVQWVATKVSGTVAGTVTLQGSVDGTNFWTLTGAATGASTTTKTATDVASQTTAWVIGSNPCKYYRVTWTGAGTMVATQAAKLMVQ